MSSTTEFLRQVQQDHDKWSRYNFPDAQPWEPLLGIVEEAGELAAALRIHELHKVDHVTDAVGDLVLFMADYCTKNNLSLSDCWRWCADRHWDAQKVMDSVDRVLLTIAGPLCHHHLKREQKIRGAYNSHQKEISVLLGTLLATAEVVCSSVGTSLEAAVATTSAQVWRRDWQKYPQTGYAT